MRVLTTALMLVTLTFIGACNKSEKGGGAAAGNSYFTLTAPSSSTVIKQGESRVIQVDVKRDKEFAEDVTLKAEVPAGSGLTAELVQATAKNDTAKVDLKVTAALNAIVGEQKVRIIGTPTKGNATEVTVPVKVEAPPSQK